MDVRDGKMLSKVKCVFKTKYYVDGSVQRHKARLITKGYSQQQGIDFDEIFSAIALLDVFVQLKWKVYQFDVKYVFLNGDLEEEVFVTQPDGYAEKGKKNKVYKFRKALYRLKKVLRAW